MNANVIQKKKRDLTHSSRITNDQDKCRYGTKKRIPNGITRMLHFKKIGFLSEFAQSKIESILHFMCYRQSVCV